MLFYLKFEMRFIDLFAGIGGFHLALSKLGHQCVFASELMPELQSLYKTNHNIECTGDINQVDIKNNIPEHDILCGGFPCQPFSQAGSQQGFNDEKDRGNLFYKIMEILEHHQPEFVFLENVPNLKSFFSTKSFKSARLCMIWCITASILFMGQSVSISSSWIAVSNLRYVSL